MADMSLIQILGSGGTSAMFAFLLWWTLSTSQKREERLLQKLDEISKTQSSIVLQLESLAREIDRMRGND